MELKQFVKTALADITSAVAELQSELQNGAIFNPALNGAGGERDIVIKEKYYSLERINFDIEVSVADAKLVAGNVNTSAGFFGVKAKGSKGNNRGEVSRINFSLPVIFPRPE